MIGPLLNTSILLIFDYYHQHTMLWALKMVTLNSFRASLYSVIQKISQWQVTQFLKSRSEHLQKRFMPAQHDAASNSYAASLIPTLWLLHIDGSTYITRLSDGIRLGSGVDISGKEVRVEPENTIDSSGHWHLSASKFPSVISLQP